MLQYAAVLGALRAGVVALSAASALAACRPGPGLPAATTTPTQTSPAPGGQPAATPHGSEPANHDISPAPTSDGTPKGDQILAAHRWLRLVALTQAALERGGVAGRGLLDGQDTVWHLEVELYDRRLDGLRADLAAVADARPALLAAEVARRLAEGESLQHVALSTDTRIAAGRVELETLVATYTAARADRQFLLDTLSLLRRESGEDLERLRKTTAARAVPAP